MWRRARIRPSRAVSAIATMVGAGMTVFGIYLLPLTDAHPFIIVWLIGAAGITLYHLYNTLSGRAAALEVVDFEHGDPGSSVGERLEQLNRLKQQGLITESEFQDKRKKIVDQL